MSNADDVSTRSTETTRRPRVSGYGGDNFTLNRREMNKKQLMLATVEANNFIEKVLGRKIVPANVPVPNSGDDADEKVAEAYSDAFCQALESGEILCEVVQKLSPSSVKTIHRLGTAPVQSSSSSSSSDSSTSGTAPGGSSAEAAIAKREAQARENISIFKSACESLGINEATLFTHTTLVSKNLKTLLACLFQIEQKFAAQQRSSSVSRGDAAAPEAQSASASSSSSYTKLLMIAGIVAVAAALCYSLIKK